MEIYIKILLINKNKIKTLLNIESYKNKMDVEFCEQ